MKYKLLDKFKHRYENYAKHTTDKMSGIPRRRKQFCCCHDCKSSTMSAAVAALQERNVKHSGELLDYKPDIYVYEFDNPYAPTWDPESGMVSDAGNDLSDLL